MKKFIVCGIMAAGIGLALCVNAMAAGSPKIGCFDSQGAISQSEPGKKLLGDLKAEDEKLSGALEQKWRAFTTAKDEYEKKRDSMDEKTRSRKEKELADMATELQKMRSESGSKLNEEKNAGLAPLVKKVQEIATKIGREDKYDFILEKGNASGMPTVHFIGTDKDDLTKRVIDELNKSK